MQAKEQLQPEAVMMKAFTNAYKAFGLSDADAAKLLGIGRSTLSRNTQGFDKSSKTFELQTLFVRLYRSLYALLGGDLAQMRDWFTDDNLHLQGVPKQLCFRIVGLVAVNEYLDAMRGKV